MRRSLMVVVIAMIVGYFAKFEIENLTAVQALLSLLLFSSLVAAFGVLLSLHAWARPLHMSSIASLPVREELARRGQYALQVSPRNVESAVRTVFATFLFEFAEIEDARLVVHHRLREDFDARIIDCEPSGEHPRISLLQVKARPAPATFRLAAEVMRHEGADRFVLVTPGRRQLRPGPIERLQAMTAGSARSKTAGRIAVVPIDDLDLVVGDSSPFIELFAENDPPLRLSSVLVEH